MSIASQTWKIVKSHVPLIKFRKGQSIRDHVDANLPHASSLPAANILSTSSCRITDTKRGIPEQVPSHKDLSVSNMRQTIAKRLMQSKKQIPHSYMSIESDITQLIKLRQHINRATTTHKVSLNDFIIKIAAVTLRQVPQINARWNEQLQSVELLSSVDISLAVAIPDGLITPIIKNANSRSILSISSSVKDLAARAKIGKLQLDEFQGGSFSVSNLGMFGIDHFSAVINPPQAAILAIGRTRQSFVASAKIHPMMVAIDDLDCDEDNFRVANLMNVTLSYDSRVCDQQDAARFLETFKVFIEDPSHAVGS